MVVVVVVVVVVTAVAAAADHLKSTVHKRDSLYSVIAIEL